MSEWFKRLIETKRKAVKNPCHICEQNLLPEVPAIIRLQVQEGVVEVLLCDECADFFDKSAEVLLKRRKEPKDERL